MSVRIERLTDRDIRRYKRSIENYKQRKKLFLILGFVCLGLTIVFLAAAILLGIFAARAGSEVDDYFSYEYFALFLSLCITTASFASTAFVITIIMFVLRGALFDKKIENRKAIIEEYEIYQEELRSRGEM